MKPRTFLMDDNFHQALKIAAANDGVSMSLYLANLMRLKWGWDIKSLPEGNSYRHKGE